MNLIKVTFIALILLGGFAPAQAQTRKGSAKSTAQVDKYPNFDSNAAARYWQRWIRNEQFNQDDYQGVLDLCIVAYDYLNGELQGIVDGNAQSATRKKLADKLDVGKTSEMANFVRQLSTKLQNIAASGGFEIENRRRVNIMIAKKKDYTQLNNTIYH